MFYYFVLLICNIISFHQNEISLLQAMHFNSLIHYRFNSRTSFVSLLDYKGCTLRSKTTKYQRNYMPLPFVSSITPLS